jgi:hypothetical protein
MSLRGFALLATLVTPSVTGAAGTGGEGVISGLVTFKGSAPDRKAPSRQSDPFCARTPGRDESVVVGKTGALRDVVVALPPGTKGRGKPLPPPIVDQNGCRYAPHVLVARHDQTVRVRNSDGTLHNIHAYDGDETLFNEAQVAGSPPLEKKSGAQPGSVVTLKCDVHPWMEAFLYLTDHAFARVTDGAGKFKIERVPAGTYQLEAWHPVLGKQTASVIVRAGKTSVVNFTYGELP